MKRFKNLTLLALGIFTIGSFITNGILYNSNNKLENKYNLTISQTREKGIKLEQEKLALFKENLKLSAKEIKSTNDYNSLSVKYIESVNENNYLFEEYLNLANSYENLAEQSNKYLLEKINIQRERDFYLEYAEFLDSIMGDCLPVIEYNPFLIENDSSSINLENLVLK